MKLIALEDACIRDQAIIQNSKVTRKLSLQAKSFVDLRSCAAHRKKIRVFSAFCLRSRAGYVKRAETLRLSGVSDPKKKIASDRESTIFPAIASSRYPPLFGAAHTSRGFRLERSLSTGKCICSPRSCYRSFRKKRIYGF
jgi:hypothetical protein